eukprot:4538876-Amphidinium_carterae.1
MLLPPPPSGRSSPYGPVGVRMPVTPPARAGRVPNDVIHLGEPDKYMATTQLAAHLTKASNNTRRQVDIMWMNLHRQQLDVNHEEQHATKLHQEYNQAIHAMEANLHLQAMQNIVPGTTNSGVLPL